MQDRRVSFRSIIIDAFGIACTNWAMLLVVLGSVTAGFIAIDWYFLDKFAESGASFLIIMLQLVVTVFVQYLVTERMLRRRIAAHRPKEFRNFGSLFAANFVYAIAVGIALVFFVIPGLYLGSRWMTLTPHVVENDITAMDALKKAWNDSGTSQGAFFGAFLCSLLPVAAYIGLMASTTSLADEANLFSITMDNLMGTLMSVSGWVVGVAAYRQVNPDIDGTSEVFA